MKSKKDFGWFARVTWDFHQGSRKYLTAILLSIIGTVMLCVIKWLTKEENWETAEFVWTLLGWLSVTLGGNAGLDIARDIFSPASKMYAGIEAKKAGIDPESIDSEKK